MHILKIIHGYPPHYNAGSEVYSQSIAQELSKKHRVSVFTREENPYAPDFSLRHEAHSENLGLYFVNHPQGKDGYRHAKLDQKFAALLAELQPDVAHIGHLNHLSTGIIDQLAAQQIPMLFTLHDFWLMCPRGQFLTRSIGKENNFQVCEKQENKKCASDCYRVYFSGKPEVETREMDYWASWVGERMDETRRLCKKVDHFIAPSNYLRQRFVEDFHIPSEKISYLDYGFPTHYLKPITQKNKNNNFTFSYIGTHIPAKGINLLIEAFRQIEHPAKLQIFGRIRGQSTQALRAMAQKSKQPIVFLPEYKNEEIVKQVFSTTDCIVVPSIWGENSPLVIHEAQACKIPVITANFGGMKEYVQHQVNGLLFTHRDVKSLQKQLEYAVTHREQMQKLGQRGYLYAEDGAVPDIQTHCIKLENYYSKILNEKKYEHA